MGIVGDHPESGVRFDLTRTSDAAPWVYDGSAFTPDARHSVRATVTHDGLVTVEGEDALPKEVVQRAKLLLKTAFKHSEEASPGSAPPRRVHRWRAS